MKKFNIYLKEHNISKTELSIKSQICKNTICNYCYEGKNISLSNILKLSNALNLTYDELIPLLTENEEEVFDKRDIAICENCNKPFYKRTVTQKYCSKKCGEEYRRYHDVQKNYSPITFNCANCGTVVTTKGNSKDRRTKFCSQVCEKAFYKHSKKY